MTQSRTAYAQARTPITALVSLFFCLRSQYSLSIRACQYRPYYAVEGQMRSARHPCDRLLSLYTVRMAGTSERCTTTWETYILYYNSVSFSCEERAPYAFERVIIPRGVVSRRRPHPRLSVTYKKNCHLILRPESGPLSYGLTVSSRRP